MLKKSKKSAFIMAVIFLFWGIITRIVLEAIFRNETGVYGVYLKYQTEGEILIFCLIFILIILIASGIISFFIYDRNDDHFDGLGVIRWSLAGFIYGLMNSGIDYLVRIIGLSGIEKLIKDLLGFLALVISYGVVFIIMPRIRRISREAE